MNDDTTIRGLRQARNDDADGLVALIGGIFDEYPGCVLDLEELDADLLAPRTSYARVDATLWVVEQGDRIVACAGLGWSDRAAGVAELKRLYVHADHRGWGLGTGLVDHVHGAAEEAGASAIVLWSDTRFHAGHRRYLAAGYLATGEHRDLHDPSHTTEVEFRRTLP